MKIRKAVLLLACAVSWGIAVWFAGRLWAAYPLVSVRSDVPVTGRQMEALRSALRQEDGASALVPAFWSQAEGSAESRWETCGITAILYCGEYDAVYPAVLLEGRFPAAQENGKCAVSTAAAWQLWGSEDVLGQELERDDDDADHHTQDTARSRTFRFHGFLQLSLLNYKCRGLYPV